MWRVCAHLPGRLAARQTALYIEPMQGIDVLHTVAVLTLAFLFIRGAQALSEHYLPGSGANDAARFLFGGPS